ncbi:MAG: hypothetical protein RsTaC01_1030 [Candidatus Paraimprobicoccus trichonymphae]|uniref:Uncharacterized protein n=1 Tax=Candidatus Paraimprobicoccus trichonymphae TaxID=3033793 RepID=A0AA48L076_9FIRM|nr:MAG: hypothetical protein RsTaC01_1030 [Candidatus Paraimprobicoccus trichonymphae]
MAHIIRCTTTRLQGVGAKLKFILNITDRIGIETLKTFSNQYFKKYFMVFDGTLVIGISRYELTHSFSCVLDEKRKIAKSLVEVCHFFDGAITSGVQVFSVEDRKAIQENSILGSDDLKHLDEWDTTFRVTASKSRTYY